MSSDVVSQHDPSDTVAGPEVRAEMEQAYQSMRRKMRVQSLGDRIKRTIMVLSGKGGVGKSTVAVGLALSMAERGMKVGLLDIDITGPNVPKMLGITSADLSVEDGLIVPVSATRGVRMISMGLLLEEEDKPVVWRGPIKLGAIQQFIGDVAWGDLDALVIDFPPGTSDEPLTVAQTLPHVDGMVVVTTPQEVAILDSRRAVKFAETLKIPVLGILENMSGYTIEGVVKTSDGASLSSAEVSIMGPREIPLTTQIKDDGSWSIEIDLFKQGGGKLAADDLGVPFLGALPFDPGVVRSGDDGVHRIISDPDGRTALAFQGAVSLILEHLNTDASETRESPQIL